MKYLSSRLILSVVSVATNFLSSCFYGCFTRGRHGNHSGVEERRHENAVMKFLLLLFAFKLRIIWQRFRTLKCSQLVLFQHVKIEFVLLVNSL